MIKVFLFLCCILTSASKMTNAMWSSSSSSFSTKHHHDQVPVNEGGRVVIGFEEDGKVSISQEDSSSRSCQCNKIKNKLGESARKAGEIAIKVVRKATTMVGRTIGMVSIADSIEGTLNDAVVKLEEWDPVDSPKRIGEDIRQNASLKIEQGAEEVKETVENVMETSPNEVVTSSKNAISDVLVMVSSMRSVMINWCHLLGFSIAYGMGVWVTFFSGCGLGKCLPKQKCAMVLSKVNMVYFRAMGYSVGVALFGFLVSQGTRGVLSNKMEMFQGFNLVSALVMILSNLVFLEPQATKFIVQKMKETGETENIVTEKLKKINAYSSTLNVSTMVVLTWHLAYIGQLLQTRY